MWVRILNKLTLTKPFEEFLLADFFGFEDVDRVPHELHLAHVLVQAEVSLLLDSGLLLDAQAAVLSIQSLEEGLEVLAPQALHEQILKRLHRLGQPVGRAHHLKRYMSYF